MSKGSGRRPAAISAQEFAEKWAQTFGHYGRSEMADDIAATGTRNAIWCRCLTAFYRDAEMNVRETPHRPECEAGLYKTEAAPLPKKEGGA